MTCPLWAIVKKWPLFFVFFLVFFFVFCLVLFFVFCLVLFFAFSTFLLVLKAFSSRPLVYKGRAHCTEASWYLAASQAVIKSYYWSVITLSTRDFWSQFLWLLPPIGGEATYVIPLWSRYRHRHSHGVKCYSRDHAFNTNLPIKCT